MSHRLVYMMGPSGAGKDSVLHSLQCNWSFAVPAYFARRTITRPVKPDGEQHEAVDVPGFEQLLQARMFSMNWQANGLSYGIRHTELEPLRSGHWLFVNGSRAYLPLVLKAWPKATIVHLVASRNVLAQRLAQRGRETEDEVAQRLSREVQTSLPAGVIAIDNSGTLAASVDALQRVLGTLVQEDSKGY